MKKMFLSAVVGALVVGAWADEVDAQRVADAWIGLYASSELPEVKNGNPHFVLYPLEHTAYTIWYSSYFGGPACVVERLRKTDFDETVAKRSDCFHPDEILEKRYPNIPRAVKKSYSNSGFDRGHQAPSADYTKDQALQDDTFSMANMLPQVGDLNQKQWAKLEEWVRMTAKVEGDIVVLSGPIMRQDEVFKLAAPTNWVLGKGDWRITEPKELQIAVPDACYKVVVDLTPPCKLIAFRMVNDAAVCKTQTWQNCVCSLDRIENETRLELLKGLQKKFPELEKPLDCWAME